MAFRPWEALHALITQMGTSKLTGRTVLIIGGTRGLGLDLGRLLAARGCKLALCARDPDEVERARLELVGLGAAVFARVCDASDEGEVSRLVADVVERFGSVDMLITCAATIQVGPVEMMSRDDVEEALAQIFWTSYHPTMAVLPYMRARRGGSIVHVSSFGGKLGMPHLLPYCTAKFALTGFSASLRAEVAKDGITVTTITPGLLRTGAHVNAPFKGQRESEYLWFSAGTTLPFVSLASKSAARRILRVAARGQAESTLTLGVRLAVIANALSPGLVARVLALQNELLPSSRSGSHEPTRGMDVAARARSHLVRAIDRLGRGNAIEHHAYPGPIQVEPHTPSHHERSQP